MSPIHHEQHFESAIEQALLSNGWCRGSNDGYHRDLALDTEQMFTFIGATQAQQWDKLRDFYGHPDDAQRQFAQRVSKEIDTRGALDVLRHGVKDHGIAIRLAYFRPAHTIAEHALKEYRENRLSVTRQLRYSASGKELDLALFVNGIPVATAELKNPLTNQTVEGAKHQYRVDRDPKEPLFGKRALVHFAVDPELVFITTRLAGQDTRFLPFNIGTNGPGVSGGAGNPPNPNGYRTSYLWERIWQRDNWLDIIRHYLHVEKPEDRKSKKSPHQLPVIFPRLHQWDAVGSLTDHARAHGPGHNYLVQHSAGSGKSNTIAWLAHQLSSLHGADNAPVFDKTIVITDRDVLDRQLQDTIYQFEHTSGVVERIRSDGAGSKSAQVAAALANATAKIVIVTLQTFPYVLDQTAKLRGKRYAIIVDEAHSSQSGESAAALKKVLLKLGSDDMDENGDPLTASALARGKHDSLSYFAFTATPKAKTLELFGEYHKSEDKHRPFHVYSMRQAIEEGFILDVLRNYITYKTYFKLANANPDDPEVDPKKAMAQLVRFAELSPQSMAQRAEVIVEHFYHHVTARLGGRAKAMVVTRSRESAAKLFRAIKDYVATRGYPHCESLVAFSGELEIDGEKLTESKINGFPESQLPKRFDYTKVDAEKGAQAQPEYRILVVADKYQTGFDQPLLTTMYVDKKLDGVAAVQTLSRLNRTHRFKNQEDIFVLDMANDAEGIQDAFRPFYETSVAAPTDPNVMYDAQRAVLDHQLLVPSEIEHFVAAYLAAEGKAGNEKQWRNAHAALYAHTDPARDRFVKRREDDPDDAEEFRGHLSDFLRKYGFLAQIIGNPDSDLEELYLYGKHLITRLPRREDPSVDIGNVDLTNLRISRTGEHDIRLDPTGEQELRSFAGDGTGRANDPELMSLSELIEEFNAKYGTDFTESDLTNPMEKAMEVPKIQAAALNNDEENFGHVFNEEFEARVYDRIEENTKFLRKFADDGEFRSDFTKLARRRAYEMLRRNVA